jgi:hypothetical protein
MAMSQMVEGYVHWRGELKTKQGLFAVCVKLMAVLIRF